MDFLNFESDEEFLKTGYLLFHIAGLVMDVAEKYNVPTKTVIDVITESIIWEEEQKNENLPVAGEKKQIR